MLTGSARIAWYTGVAGPHAVRSVESVGNEPVLKNLGVGSDDFFKLVEALLQFPAITRPEPRFLSLTVLAWNRVSFAPPT